MECEKLFGIIDDLKEEYIQFLIDVCNIESPTDYKEGVDRVGNYFAEKAIAKGWKVERQHQEISGDVICITMNPDAKGEHICFSGHMDTVHPLGSFGNPPVKVDDEKIYGPGTTDCKGGCVVSFLAMDALERYGFKDRPIKLILQSDEENGSRNSNKTTVKYMYEQAKGCIAFLNAEPGGMNGHSITRKGICKFRFEITGKAAHSGNCANGISAICEAAQKIIRLEKYKDSSSITCNCGIIEGGSAENTVPEKCTFTADFRYNTESEKAEIMKIAEEIANTSYIEGSSCDYVLASSRCPMEKTERNVELFEKIRKIYLDHGFSDIEMFASEGGADASDLTQMGITCLDNFGIGGGYIHNLGEFAYIKHLTLSAKKMALIACCLK